MICNKCALGADLITQLRDSDSILIHSDSDDFIGMNEYRARDFISVARTLHHLCKGETHCACQHNIDFMVTKTVDPTLPGVMKKYAADGLTPTTEKLEPLY